MTSERARTAVLLDRDFWIAKRPPGMRPDQIIFFSLTKHRENKLVQLRGRYPRSLGCVWMRHSDSRDTSKPREQLKAG